MLNIVGLGVGKWINNIGAIGTFIAAAVLDRLSALSSGRASELASPPPISKFPPNPRFVFNSFGVICFGLVGLELASVMGDEIQDPAELCPARSPGEA